MSSFAPHKAPHAHPRRDREEYITPSLSPPPHRPPPPASSPRTLPRCSDAGLVRPRPPFPLPPPTSPKQSGVTTQCSSSGCSGPAYSYRSFMRSSSMVRHSAHWTVRLMMLRQRQGARGREERPKVSEKNPHRPATTNRKQHARQQTAPVVKAGLTPRRRQSSRPTYQAAQATGAWKTGPPQRHQGFPAGQRRLPHRPRGWKHSRRGAHHKRRRCRMQPHSPQQKRTEWT